MPFGSRQPACFLIIGLIFVKLQNGFSNSSVLFQHQRFGRLVANLGRTEILYRTGIDIARVHSPLVTMCGEIFERSPIEANQRFLYNRFHFSVTAFHIHHHSHRHAPGNPLAGRFGRVANRRHITRFALAYQQCCGITERITIVGIEIGRIGTTAFVSEEVELLFPRLLRLLSSRTALTLLCNSGTAHVN